MATAGAARLLKRRPLAQGRAVLRSRDAKRPPALGAAVSAAPSDGAGSSSMHNGGGEARAAWSGLIDGVAGKAAPGLVCAAAAGAAGCRTGDSLGARRSGFTWLPGRSCPPQREEPFPPVTGMICAPDPARRRLPAPCAGGLVSFPSVIWGTISVPGPLPRGGYLGFAALEGARLLLPFFL